MLEDNEIRNMEAGRQMDALVAEHVFGREICHIHHNLFCCGRGKGFFSTDIAAAWEVVERLQDDDWIIRLWSPNDSGEPPIPAHTWRLEIWKVLYQSGELYDFAGRWEDTQEISHRGDADTAPLAICRAALLAVMETKQE